MKAPEIKPHLNSSTVAPHRKAKNTPTRLHKRAVAGVQRRLLAYQQDKTRLSYLQTLQARIDANAYPIDSITIAQQMLRSSTAGHRQKRAD